jgi:hypothetical protein
LTLPKPKFSLSPDGELFIYEHPELDTRYTIGIDTGGGVGLDYTVGCILSNRLPFEQVAIWRSNKKRTAHAAEELARLGRYYNRAMIIPETNAMGFGLASCLIDNYRYTNVYSKEEHLDRDPHISDKLGWATTQTGKHLLITEFQQAWRERAIILHDKQTIEEFCRYIYIENKDKTGATEGLHDDCVIATLLALHGARCYPQESRTKPQKQSLSTDVLQARRMMERFSDKIRSRLTGKVAGRII